MVKKTGKKEPPGQKRKSVKKAKKARSAESSRKKIEISGQVRDRQTQTGIEGLKIEVWHDGGRSKRIMIRSTKTTAYGNFHFTLTSLDFDRLDLPSKLKIFFRIYLRNSLIKSTDDDLIKGVDSDEEGILIEVDLPSEQHVFVGKLLDARTGSALVGYIILAKLTDTDPDTDLGSALTSAAPGKEGEFEFVYTTKAVTDPVPAPIEAHLNLIIRDQGGRQVSLPNLAVRENEPFEVRVTFPQPPGPLPPGTVGNELPFDQSGLQSLFTAAATADNPGLKLWVKDDSELLVLTAKVKVKLDEGLVLVTIPVSCEQIGSAEIQVPFAVGSQDQPAGMVIATEERPRGPEMIVDVWGEALTAYAWQIFMTVAGKVAAVSGVDEDGSGLIPVAITAAPDGLRILTMARHTFDRVLR